jgi:hypothetical protein
MAAKNPTLPLDPSEERIQGVYRREVERMLEILAKRILTVMEAHRYAEEDARIYNRIGRKPSAADDDGVIRGGRKGETRQAEERWSLGPLPHQSCPLG